MSAKGVAGMMVNSGQTCSAPSRMLVPKARMNEAIARRRKAAASVTVGDPNGNFAMGPVVSKASSIRSRDYIQKGIEEVPRWSSAAWGVRKDSTRAGT